MKFILQNIFYETIISFCCSLISNIGCTQNSNKKTGQDNIHVGGSCEGCEAIHESPIPFDSLKNLCWLLTGMTKGRKLAINGIVYKADGTPAPNVIIYVYHTDQTGIYPKKGDEKGWAKRHGYIRGWMRTNEKGEYKFFTLRPAAYPGRQVRSIFMLQLKNLIRMNTGSMNIFLMMILYLQIKKEETARIVEEWNNKSERCWQYAQS
jgi:hypothetical protein